MGKIKKGVKKFHQRNHKLKQRGHSGLIKKKKPFAAKPSRDGAAQHQSGHDADGNEVGEGEQVEVPKAPQSSKAYEYSREGLDALLWSQIGGMGGDEANGPDMAALMGFAKKQYGAALKQGAKIEMSAQLLSKMLADAKTEVCASLIRPPPQPQNTHTHTHIHILPTTALRLLRNRLPARPNPLQSASLKCTYGLFSARSFAR